MNKRTPILPLLGPAWALGAFVSAEPTDSGKPGFSVEKIGPWRIAYVVHQGPYWSVAEPFAKVRQLSFEKGDFQGARPFIRYLSHPTKTRPSDLRMEIGFILPDAARAPEGFAEKSVGPFEVASPLSLEMTITDHADEVWFRSSMDRIENVTSWLESQRLDAAGDVFELHSVSNGSALVWDIVIPLAPARPVSEPSAMETGESLIRLIESKHYSRFAEAVMPESGHAHPADWKWLTDVSDRLRVIREVATLRLGADADAVSTLLNPVIARSGWLYRGVRSDLPAEVLPAEGTAAVRPEGTTSTSEARVKRRAELLRQLDRVMVKMHMGKTSSKQIADELAQLLAEVPSLLENPHDPATGPTEVGNGNPD